MADINVYVEPIPSAGLAEVPVLVDPFYAAREWEFVPIPTESCTETFINRVFDSVASTFVRWSTENTADTLGASYPGPGTFGVDTSDYCVESKVVE